MAVPMKQSIVNAFCFAGVSLWSAPSVNACAVGQSHFRLETLDSAETVFRGHVSAYEIIEGNFVKLKFKTIETYKGQKRPEWTLIWANSTFAVPDNIEEFRRHYGDDTMVGVTPTATVGPNHAPSSVSISPRNPETLNYPWVMQSPCAPPIMVKWNNHWLQTLIDRGTIPARQR